MVSDDHGGRGSACCLRPRPDLVEEVVANWNAWIVEVEWMDGEKRSFEAAGYKVYGRTPPIEERDGVLHLSRQDGEGVAARPVITIPLVNVRGYTVKARY